MDTMRLLDSAIALAMITAYLFCASTAYVHGYFNTLSLDSDVLDRNFHQVLYHGMILNLTYLFLLPLFFFVYNNIKKQSAQFSSKAAKNNFGLAKKIVKCQQFLKVRPINRNLIIQSYQKKEKHSRIVFLIFIVFIISMYSFESSGKNSASEKLDNIKNNKFNSIRFNLSTPRNQYALLFCGSRNCVAYDTKNNENFYFQQKDFRYKKHSENKLIK